jgi:hypothetical protein
MHHDKFLQVEERRLYGIKNHNNSNANNRSTTKKKKFSRSSIASTTSPQDPELTEADLLNDNNYKQQLIKDYNLETDQINDMETLKQCSEGYDYGLPQVIKILQIMVFGTLYQKIDDFLNSLKSYSSGANQSTCNVNRKLERKFIEDHLIDIIDFLLEQIKSLGFNSPCDSTELPK